MKVKEYSLLMCWPTPGAGYGAGANKGIGDFVAESKPAAIKHFQDANPTLGLDATGYAKIGETTYVVAEGAEKEIWDH